MSDDYPREKPPDTDNELAKKIVDRDSIIVIDE